jgi:hypothetical protein
VEIFLSTREESIILMKVFRNFGFSSKWELIIYFWLV